MHCSYSQTLVLIVGSMLLMPLATTQDTVPGLRELAASHEVVIGTAVRAAPFAEETQFRDVIAREFNVITTENVLKCGPLRPSREEFAFERADAMVAFAQEHGIKVRGHALVWHNQLPAWITEGEFSRDELLAILREHIFTVMTHYRGRVYAWDVVNEAMDSEGGYRETIFYRTIGPEYLAYAFHWAREADPGALLFYNDFKAEGNAERSRQLFHFVRELKSRGVPIDGVGLQMHLNTKRIPSLRDMRASARRFGKLGLQVHITELDVRLTMPPEENDLKRQQRIYEKFARLLRDEPACTALVTWGFTDKHSWIPNHMEGYGDALLFDTSYTPKATYHAIATVLNAP